MTYPLSQTQMGIYVTCMNTQEEEGNYNIDLLFKLEEDVDPERLAKALDKVIEAHPYVKSRLVTDENGEVVFEDHTADEFHTSVFEINDIEEVRAHLGADFDLMHDQLFRLEIYKTMKGNFLYMDFHHIVSDGFSMQMLFEELSEAYDGKELEAEEFNGFDIALNEVEMRKMDKYEKDKAWYMEEFGSACDIDSTPIADIYNDDKAHYARKYVKLNVDHAAKDVVCRKALAHESLLFTAAFGMTLSKYSGEQEVLYTTGYHGRTDKRTLRSFTMMVKTLPVYHNFNKATTVQELLQQIKVQNKGIRQHNAYSFAEMSADMGITSGINFVYQGSYRNSTIMLNGKPNVGETLITNTPGLKFLCMIMIENGEYYIWLEYQKNKYSEAFINGFIATYEHIVDELCKKETLAEVTVCGDGMLKKLDSFNAKENLVSAEEDANETVLSLFQKAAKQYPENIAAVFKEKRYAYKQLDELTDKIGTLIYNKVKDCGKQEPVVSILIPRNEYMFILPLSAMKAGCAYQPLDPSYPQERLNFMVKDADAALLLADPELRPIINEYECDTLLTSELTEEVLNSFTLSHPNTLTPQSLFILLYTSGSTGVPKGVMLEHQNLISFIKWYRRYYDLKPEDNVAAYASFGFDANMMDQYPALTTGATVHVIPEEDRLDLVAINDYYEKNNITHSFITTQVGVQFLLNADNHSLKHLTIGGEKLMSVDPAANYAFYNAYGPTECSIFTTTFPVHAKEANIPIGKPTDELECYVMDKQLHRLPIGAAGELVIVGKQVGRGYLNRPDKTAEAFFTYNGKRAYHSGDIVRYREDGNIEFVGRKDGQVKIRGFRIELKEVEAVIREFTGIKDVTVQAFDDPNGGKYIAAYIVSDKEVDIEALNNFILDQKPPYMVPAVTMQIPEIPLNVNQKVDKKALPKPEVKTKAASDAPAAPLNALETELKTIIASVVNTEEFGITDVLGYVGLTSISSIKLATLIYKKYGIQVDSKSLAKTGTLQSIENEILAKWMKGEVLSSEDSNNITTSQPHNHIASSAPLTYPQMGVYMDCMKNPGSILYNVPSKIVFNKDISSDDLQASVKATVGNHKSFLLTFSNKNGEICQLLNADMPIEVPVKELTMEEAKEFEQGFIRPFNLGMGPLFRFEIVKTPQQLILYIDIHHLIIDGSSLDLIIREIATRLNHEETEKEEYSYIQFALDQKEVEGGEEYKAAREFFHTRLATCEGASEITADMPKNDNAVHTLGTKSRPVDLAPVEAMAKRLGVTPMSVFLAAAYYTVSRFVNNKQVYLGTISNGRSNLRTYNTTGMFVNTLALSSEIKEQTVTEYIKETAENFIETINHEQYPFAQIAADYGFKPEIIFEYQVGVISGSTVRGVQVSPKGLSLDLAKFKNKIVVCDAADGGHEIQIGYDEAVYSSVLAQNLAASVSAVVKHFVSQPDALVKNISIMCKEQEQQVAALRTTALMDVPFKRFYEPIEYWAKETPEALAVYACDRQLTFRQFNEECNRVAHALMAKGVKRGDRIVLLLPRNSQVLCCIFGVSKTGAAYIPCDPAYPAERINLITEDSEATYVITTREHMAEHKDNAILVDELFNSNNKTDNPCVTVEPEDLAYLIYTSGSTGRPKGVMLRHIGICSYLYDHPANIHIHGLKTEGVKAFVCITTLSFDMSLKEFAGALHNGITAVLANEDEVNNPILLAELFRKTGAQAINGTPSRILNCMESEEFCEALSRCKVIWSGGEKYSDKLLERLHAMNLRIFNTYGPTEITVSSNIGELTNQQNITVGHPLLNYTEFVVDSDGNELPVGVVGELYIGGPGVALGYNNLSKQTAERFIEYHGMRVYRSGDYARWLSDGQVDILGRLDNQVKLNGLRIELGEVESAISKVKGVKQTVVMICNIDGRDHLTAYFTADRQIDIEMMKAQIGTTLTHYMVPTAYLQMEAFPLTPNGKTDVKNLPEPQLLKVGGDFVAPKNKVEENFCHAFGKILNLDKVSAADSFFELGGTSLTATRVIIEAKNYGYDVAYSEVFSNPTAQALAKLVSGGNADEDLDTEVTDYDYSKINELLVNNNLDNFRKGERLLLNNVLLTGANGYLGIHVLHNLLENHLKQNPQYKVYCFVRHGKEGLSSVKRLQSLLFYYFDNGYDEVFGKQLIVIDGDVTNSQAFDEVIRLSASEQPQNFTVINCAAIVKHFSEGTEIEDINIGGLQNCVDFCLKTGARLIQTSTISTCGESVNGYPDPQTNYGEQIHYFGQHLRSKYTHSKFLAERIVLESIIEKGLVAKVVRLGNLAPRVIDGEFQINFRTNSAMGRLHIFQMLGACSYKTSVSKMEFSPIDEVAEAILRLSTTPKECCIFHPFNDHMVKLGDVVREMARTLNVDIAEVEEEDFQSRLNEAAQNPEKAQILQSMLAYKTNGKDKVSYFDKYNPYTIQVLARLGFHWNVTSWDYVQRFISAIAALGFFDDDYHR